MEKKTYRNVLVCWNGYRCVGWKTQEEFQQLNEVNWYTVGQVTTYLTDKNGKRFEQPNEHRHT